MDIDSPVPCHCQLFKHFVYIYFDIVVRLFFLLFIFISETASYKHIVSLYTLLVHIRERTGLVVRASDSGSGDPSSILGQVGVLFP